MVACGAAPWKRRRDADRVLVFSPGWRPGDHWRLAGAHWRLATQVSIFVTMHRNSIQPWHALY
eukprot:2566128-Prymnesium_polylepis.1